MEVSQILVCILAPTREPTLTSDSLGTTRYGLEIATDGSVAIELGTKEQVVCLR